MAGAFYNLFQQEDPALEQAKAAGAAMRQELTKAGYPVPPTPIPFDQMQQIYNQYIAETRAVSASRQKELFDAEQKAKLGQETAQRQGQGLLQASGLNAPGLQPIIEQLFASGGVKKSSEQQYRTGKNLSEPNAEPLSEGRYGEILTAQDKAGETGTPTAQKLIEAEADRKGLTGDERYNFVIGELGKLAQSRAEGSTSGKIAGQEEGPAPFGKRYLDPESLQLLPQNLSVSQLRQRGAVEYDEKIGQKIADMDAAGLLVQDIDDLASSIITATDTAGAYTQKVRLEKESIQRTGPAKVYKDTKKAFLGKLQKAFGGEVGVLTNQDIERVDSALPQFSDTKAIKDYKMALFQQFVSLTTQAQKDILTGKILTRDAKKTYRPQMLKLIDAMSNPVGGKSSKETTTAPKILGIRKKQ